MREVAGRDREAAEIHRMYSSPAFRRLASRRNRISWTFTAVTLTLYVAFFIVIALAPGPFGDSMPGFGSIGFFVILLLFVVAFVLTAAYLRISRRSLVPEQARVTAEIDAPVGTADEGAAR